MCMITYIPGGVAIPWTGIYNGASWNEDGQGWAIATPDGIFTGKSFDVDKALDGLYEIRRQYPTCPALFHSRWATHGELSERNIHPFFVGKSTDTVLAHNGILPSAFHPKGMNWRSDTNNFALWLGRHENILSRRGRQVIGDLIGTGNKLVILTNSRIYDKPRGFIVNQDAGEWVEGCWFSNDGYKNRWYQRGSFGSWLYEGISTSPAISTHAELESENVAQCPICKKTGYVELEGNLCLNCDSCLDCMEAMRDCMCFWGGDKNPREAIALPPKSTGTTEETGGN